MCDDLRACAVLLADQTVTPGFGRQPLIDMGSGAAGPQQATCLSSIWTLGGRWRHFDRSHSAVESKKSQLLANFSDSFIRREHECALASSA